MNGCLSREQIGQIYAFLKKIYRCGFLVWTNSTRNSNFYCW